MYSNFTFPKSFGHLFTPSFEWSDILSSAEGLVSHSETSFRISSKDVFVDIFTQAFDQAICKIIDQFPSANFIVPLSGGLDSRLILYSLLKFVPRSRITAYTFGIPGSAEISIASLIAQHFCIEHVVYSPHEINYLEIISSLPQIGMQVNCLNPIHRIINIFPALQNPSSIIINGFLANTLAGNHFYPSDQLLSEKYSINKYLLTELRFPRISDNSDFYRAALMCLRSSISSPCFANFVLTDYEKIILSQRQQNRIQYVLGNDLPNVFSPFSSPSVAGLLLGLSYEFRFQQSLYRYWAFNYLTSSNSLHFPEANRPQLDTHTHFCSRLKYFMIKKTRNITHKLTFGLAFPFLTSYGSHIFLFFQSKSYRALFLSRHFSISQLICNLINTKHYPFAKSLFLSTTPRV